MHACECSCMLVIAHNYSYIPANLPDLSGNIGVAPDKLSICTNIQRFKALRCRAGGVHVYTCARIRTYAYSIVRTGMRNVQLIAGTSAQVYMKVHV